MARPTDYNEEIATKICDLIASTSKSLRAICLQDDMPVLSTVMLWLNKHKEFSEQYARAKGIQADFLVEEMLSIADDSSNDTMTIETRNGPIEVENKEWTNRSKLRVDTRKWIASKMLPKKYGEKLDVTTKIVKVGKQADEEKYE